MPSQRGEEIAPRTMERIGSTQFNNRSDPNPHRHHRIIFHGVSRSDENAAGNCTT